MARSIFIWLTGVLSLALGLELLFRVLPVSTSTETGYYTDPLILNYPPHHHWTTSTGWDLRNAQKLEANNLGYVAHRDFVADSRAVALIGDSFTEASMLNATDRPGVQLELALGTRPVYAMGAPGTALLDYAERIRFAHEQFGVRDFVVLMERGDVKQSLCGSGQIHGPCLDPKTFEPSIETLSAPDLAKQIFRNSALAQYLFSQLKFSPQRFWQQTRSTFYSLDKRARTTYDVSRNKNGLQPINTQFQAVDAVARTFFARVKPHVAGQLVIVIDCDRKAISSGNTTTDPERMHFIQFARAEGAIVIDTEPLFRNHLERSPLKLEVGPYDSHLNALGVRLAMQSAANGLDH